MSQLRMCVGRNLSLHSELESVGLAVGDREWSQRKAHGVVGTKLRHAVRFRLVELGVRPEYRYNSLET